MQVLELAMAIPPKNIACDVSHSFSLSAHFYQSGDELLLDGILSWCAMVGL